MKSRVLKTVWTSIVIFLGLSLLALVCGLDVSFVRGMLGSGTGFLFLALFSFACEYVDSSLGMGYGTTLIPVLLILGFTPLEAVPAILLAECVSGLSSAYAHHRAGNITFSRNSDSSRIGSLMGVCAVGGSVFAVFCALNLPAFWVKLYIGLMVFCVGLFIVFSGSRTIAFSWKRITALGLLSAFNKGISGGGYGPLMTGGQILSGIPEKKAVSLTSLSEGIVCLVSLALYLGFKGSSLNYTLMLPLLCGSILSVPCAVFTVKVLPESFLRRNIGFATLFLGVVALIKLV